MDGHGSSVSTTGSLVVFHDHHDLDDDDDDDDDCYNNSVDLLSFAGTAVSASVVLPVMDVTKLDFTRVQVYGRTNELKLLQEAYLRTSTCGSSEICLIHGYSGTGKSTLVQHQFVVDTTSNNLHHNNSRRSVTSLSLGSISDTTVAPPPFFACGKFDQLRGTKPYSALSAALSELCQFVLDWDDEHQSNHAAVGAPSLTEKVREAVGKTGANVLMSIVPGARALFADSTFLLGDNSNHASSSEDNPSDKTATTNTNMTLGSKEALQQLKFVVRTFLRTICSPQHPVVLFLDDLQWIDSASLELLKALWTDRDTQFFLFIGAYRDNEVTDVHPLMLSLRNLQQTTPEATCNNNNDSHTTTITQIKLENLEKNDILRLISDLLKVEQLIAEPLAEIVYRRTHGNVFFCLEFVRMLHQEGLLYFSMSKCIWEWSVNQILEATNAADNVVDLIVDNFNKKLPATCKNLLKIASCLANTFHSLVLWQIVKEQQDTDHSEDDTISFSSTSNTSITSSTILDLSVKVNSMEALEKLLETALKEGIIEKSPKPHWYKFTHDRFQQAAYALMQDEEEERDALHYRIGRVLMPKTTSRTEQDREWRTFVAVDQLNKGSSCFISEAGRIKMARQNLKAGHMAARMSAYVPAMEYFSAGVDFLPTEGKWDRHYHLCLDLYSSRGEVAYVVADFEETDRMCEEVLKHAKDGMDKMRAAFTRVDSLGAQQKPEECLKLGFEILRKTLDEPFPRKMNVFHVIRSLIKTQRMIRGMSDGELLSLPEMTNKSKVAAMKLLTSISTQAYWLQKPEMLALVNFRMMQLSVKYGVARLSPAAFARYGLLLCAIKGDIKEGFRFGKLAMVLVDRLDAREWESQVVCVANQFLFHWQEPLQNLMEPLLKAYQLGHELGDVEFGLLSAGGYALCYFHSGLKLGPMVKDLAGFCSQMKEYGQNTSLYATLPYLQGIQNLMGKADDPLTLTGEAMDENEVLRIAAETNNATCLQNMWFFKSQLAYFLGEFELSLELATKFRKTSESVQAHVIFPSFVFYSGLIHLALAKKTNKRKYFAGARKDISTLKGWVRDGAVNSYHKLLLLEAQYKALSRGKKRDSIKAEFENAINAAARAGFLQDRATAHQLLGEYFQKKNIEIDAKFHLTRAHALFSEWGARAVAFHLQSIYSDTLTVDATSRSSAMRSSGTGMKARSRFSSLVSSWRSNSSKSELLSKALSVADRQSVVREAPGNRNLSAGLGMSARVEESEFFSSGRDTSSDFRRKVPEVHIPTDRLLR